MPTINYYSARFEQPVSVHFQCEYCNHPFTVTGTLATDVKTEKWVSARKEEATAEMKLKAEAALQNAREGLETSISGGVLSKKVSLENSEIHFAADWVCPECGYRQRLYIPRKNGWQFYFALLGCSGILLIFFVIGLLAILQGTATELAYVFVVGIPILFAIAIGFSMRQPNQAFMKKHNLKKKDLPQPKKPEVSYGQISTVRQGGNTVSTS